jgi:hypothetical protein
MVPKSYIIVTPKWLARYRKHLPWPKASPLIGNGDILLSQRKILLVEINEALALVDLISRPCIE